MSEEEEEKTHDEVLERLTMELGEFFDTVQVFVTRYHPEKGTLNLTLGTGNNFARDGQIREWLMTKDERIREEARMDVLGDLED